MLAEAAASRFSTDRSVGGKFGDDAAAIEDQRAMADLGDLLEIRRYDDDRRAAPAARRRTDDRSPPWRRRRRPRSDPRRRRASRRGAASARPRPSAGCRPTGTRSAASDRSAATRPARRAPARRGSRGRRDERKQAQAGRDRIEEQVLAHRQIRHDRFADAVGADEIDPVRHRLARRRDGDTASVEQDAPAGHRRDPEQRPPDALLPRAAQPDETDDLARVDLRIRPARPPPP